VSSTVSSTLPQNSWSVSKSGDIFDRLEEYWYSGRTGFIPPRTQGASEAEIQAFEQTHALKLPADLRGYFLRFNGIDEGPDIFCFWPIAKLATVQTPAFNSLKATVNLREANRYFVFADYLIESHYYAIYLGDNPLFQNRVILPDFPDQPIIAPSFSSFLELYLLDDPRLFGNG